jgi:hypothetical protein
MQGRGLIRSGEVPALPAAGRRKGRDRKGHRCKCADVVELSVGQLHLRLPILARRRGGGITRFGHRRRRILPFRGTGQFL